MYVSYKVPIEVQLRIFGFAEAQCTFTNFHRVLRDPLVRERIDEALAARRLAGRFDVNIFSSYKTIPADSGKAHLNFPANFEIEDQACVLAVFHHMTEDERRELRERVLDEDLQREFSRIVSEDSRAMQAGDFSRGDSQPRFLDVLRARVKLT